MRRSEFLAGLLIGGLIGAVAALLYTPESGTDLRVQARHYAEKVRDEVKQAALTRREQLENQLQVLRAPQHPPAE